MRAGAGCAPPNSRRLAALPSLLLACGACSKDVIVPCPIFSPASVTVSPQPATLAPGESVTFRALVTGVSSMPLTCGEVMYPAFPRAVTWSASNATVASIVSSSESTAVLRATGTGTATMVAIGARRLSTATPSIQCTSASTSAGKDG